MQRPLARKTPSLAFLLFIATTLWSADAMSESASPRECDVLAVKAEEASGLGTAAERARWLEREGLRCVGKGIYDIRLALLYLEGGELADADRIAKQGLKAGSTYAPNLNQVLAETTLRRGDRAGAEQMALAIAKKYPGYAPILGFLAEFAMAEKRWDKYLELFRRAHDLEPDKALPLLGMAVALHQLDRHQECVETVRRALQIEPARVGQTTGVKEAIFSLGILKRNDEAADLLRRHMKANPGWARDAGMVSAAKALHLAN